MDSSDAAPDGARAASRKSAEKARDEKRAARSATRAAEVERTTNARMLAKAAKATVDALRPGAFRKFSLAVLVLIAATVATGAAVDYAVAALRVRRDVDFSTGGAADGARACAAASAVASTSVTPSPVARVVAPDLTGMGARFAALAVSCATGVSGAPLLSHDFDGSAPIACTRIRPDNAVFHFLDTETDLRTAFARRVSRRRRKV